MIGEQYKIKGIVQVETIRHKRDVHKMEPANKERRFLAFSKDGINMSRLGHGRGEMFTKILQSLVTS